MKTTFWILLSLLTLVAATAGAQSEIRWNETPRVGIAIEESSSAPLVNLAALGTGNATGLGWSGYYDGSGLTGGTFHAALGRMSYAFRQFDGNQDHEIGMGMSPFDGFYLGGGVRWTPGEDAGINGHMLMRPTDWLSFGVKGQSLNQDPWMEWGAGFRPLMFSDRWRSRLTMFYDGRMMPSGSYENLAAGLRTMPVDGVELYGHWDFRDDKMVTGVNFSLNRFLAGGETTVYGDRAFQEGNTQAFVSARQMRSLKARPRTLVVYDMAQVITDTPRSFPGMRGMSPKARPTRSLYEFLVDMDRLSQTSSVDAVLFDRQAFVTSFSNMLEIEAALLRLKESGKEIYFYEESVSSRKYALAASVADGIFMSPQGAVDLTGFGVTKLYFKDLLAKYGVEIRNFRSHEYKTAFDSLSESDMTDAQRESLESIYGELQDELDRMILEGRGDQLAEELDSLYAEGFWMSASRADEAGLVDDLFYEDELESWIRDGRFRVDNFSRHRWDMEYEWKTSAHAYVAVIYANGPIMDGIGRMGGSIGTDSLAAAIRKARENPMVKGIVLRVNSGGGSALASDIIAHEVALTTGGDRPKPVVVSMGGVAASGGYMVAAPGTEILATPATITGSIGVITVIPDVSGMLERLEIGSEVLTTTESADTPNLFRSLTEEESARIRASVMDRYDSFVDFVALERDLDDEAVDAAARGQIWTGQQAVDLGLVDDIGGLVESIDLAKSLAGTKNARIIEINPGRPNRLMPGMPNSLAAWLDLEAKRPLDLLPDDLADVIDFYRTVSAYETGEPLYMMPYTLDELGLNDKD